MTALLVLIPVALTLGFIGLLAFVWALRRGQFDDLEGDAYRILNDDDQPLDPAARQGRNTQSETRP